MRIQWEGEGSGVWNRTRRWLLSYQVMSVTGRGFPGSSLVREPICNAGDTGLIPGLGKSPRAENGKPDKYSCLGNSMERGAWRATVPAVTKEADMT